MFDTALQNVLTITIFLAQTGYESAVWGQDFYVMVFIPELEQGLTGSSALENVGLQGRFDNECGKINGTPGKALEFIREHGGPIAQRLQPSNSPDQNRQIFIQSFLPPAS